ncbi:MAG: DUF1294 domain-containing protein [Oscillospiraceae bacterium]|nr:DUF1294 domain-containing protein [Oscillospiraceae bacterium]
MWCLPLLLINALGFLNMYLDKRKARTGAWRIPERTLLLAAFLGGSLGTLLGMLVFHHKTRKLKFQILVPLFLLLHLGLLVYFLLQ